MINFIENIKKIELVKKKANIINICLVVLLFIFLFFGAYKPLAVKTHLLAEELRAFKIKLDSVHSILKAKDNLRIKRRLLSRKEVSFAIDVITRTGRELNINFISINPKEIEKVEGYKYLSLPIVMDIESTYQGMGLFLGALENLDVSIVSVKSLQIQRVEEKLPQLKTRLIAELFLEGN